MCIRDRHLRESCGFRGREGKMKYSFAGRIRYSEIDESGRLSLYSLINYFQDCSNFHAEDRNVGLTWTRENHAAWILAGWQIQVRSYPAMGLSLIHI